MKKLVMPYISIFNVNMKRHHAIIMTTVDLLFMKEYLLIKTNFISAANLDPHAPDYLLVQ